MFEITNQKQQEFFQNLSFFQVNKSDLRDPQTCPTTLPTVSASFLQPLALTAARSAHDWNKNWAGGCQNGQPQGWFTSCGSSGVGPSPVRFMAAPTT
jgi:hypothetical protein